MSKMIESAVKNILNDWVAELRRTDNGFLKDENLELLVCEDINVAGDHLIQVCVKAGLRQPIPIYWVKMGVDSISVGNLIVYEDTERVSFNDPMLIPKLKGLLNASLHQTLDMINNSGHIDLEWIKANTEPLGFQGKE